jgi:predicted PurR-regulated permease PerM
MTLNSTQRRTLTWIAIALVALLLLWLLAPVLAPFLVGAVLAYVLEPAVEALARRRVPRVLAVVIVELAAIVLVLAVLLLVVPIVSRQLPLLREQLPLLADRINQGLGPWLGQLGIELKLDLASAKEFFTRALGRNLDEWLGAAFTSARIGGSLVLALIGNAIVMPLVVFYLLLDWHRLKQRMHRLVPPRLAGVVESFLAECDALIGQYLRGQLMVMLSLAAFYSVGLALFGFQLALPVGVLTGLLVFIPYLGFGLGLALALVAAVLQFASWYGVIAVAVVYGLGQLLESFYLPPYLVGERIGLNPLAVIFALLAFGHLFGFVGVLIALPASALAMVALRRAHDVYLASRLYLG